jgi:hypothetical protein
MEDMDGCNVLDGLTLQRGQGHLSVSHASTLDVSNLPDNKKVQPKDQGEAASA